jgi:hypothetical protein
MRFTMFKTLLVTLSLLVVPSLTFAQDVNWEVDAGNTPAQEAYASDGEGSAYMYVWDAGDGIHFNVYVRLTSIYGTDVWEIYSVDKSTGAPQRVDGSGKRPLHRVGPEEYYWGAAKCSDIDAINREINKRMGNVVETTIRNMFLGLLGGIPGAVNTSVGTVLYYGVRDPMSWVYSCAFRPWADIHWR